MASELVDLIRVRNMAATGVARDIRLAAGISLAEFGSRIGAPGVTIWRWEKGQRVPHGAAALRYGAELRSLQRAVKRMPVREATA